MMLCSGTTELGVPPSLALPFSHAQIEADGGDHTDAVDENSGPHQYFTQGVIDGAAMELAKVVEAGQQPGKGPDRDPHSVDAGTATHLAGSDR